MALPGEIGHAGTNCMDCDTPVELKVCRSAAGFFVGTVCPKCPGTYSRESGYYPDEETAQRAMDSGNYGRSTDFHPGPLVITKLK